jgi:hypothetical protein
MQVQVFTDFDGTLSLDGKLTSDNQDGNLNCQLRYWSSVN